MKRVWRKGDRPETADRRGTGKVYHKKSCCAREVAAS